MEMFHKIIVPLHLQTSVLLIRRTASTLIFPMKRGLLQTWVYAEILKNHFHSMPIYLGFFTAIELDLFKKGVQMGVSKQKEETLEMQFCMG